MTVPFHPSGDKSPWWYIFLVALLALAVVIMLIGCSVSVRSGPTTTTTRPQDDRRTQAIASITDRLDHDMWANDGRDHVTEANKLYNEICGLKAKGQTSDQIAANVGDTAYRQGATLAQTQETGFLAGLAYGGCP